MIGGAAIPLARTRIVRSGVADRGFHVDHGDIDIMSEKATVYDWRMRSKYCRVHAAGVKSHVEAKAPKERRKGSAD